MRVAAVDEVRKEIGYDDIEDVNAVIRSALDSASDTLSAHLRTPLDLALRADHFSVGDVVWLEGVSRLKLLLTQGFVSTIGFSVYYADRIELLEDPAGRIDITEKAVLAGEKGAVAIPGLNLQDRFVRVEYMAGFAASDDDPDQADLSKVPGWLQMAAKTLAHARLAGNRMIYEDAAKAPNAKDLMDQAASQVAGRVRYVPSAKDPLIRMRMVEG